MNSKQIRAVLDFIRAFPPLISLGILVGAISLLIGIYSRYPYQTGLIGAAILGGFLYLWFRSISKKKRLLQAYFRLAVQALGTEIIALQPLPNVINRATIQHQPKNTERSDFDPYIEYATSLIRFTYKRYGIESDLIP